MTRHRVVLVLLLGATALLIGCGGSSSKTTAGSAAAATGSDSSGDPTAFRQCLSDHGVTLPAGGPGAFSDGGPGALGGPDGGAPPSFPAGSDQGAMQSAIEACQSLAPAGGARGQGRQAFQAYTSCLADHGVVVPAAASTDSSAAGPPPTFDRSDPAFASADEICRPLLPQAATSTTVAP